MGINMLISLQLQIERLELRVAELIKERDKYDKRRREAIESANQYRDELIESRKRVEELESNNSFLDSYGVFD
jgi:hypothetical protein